MLDHVTEGAQPDGRSGGVSLLTGAALCAQGPAGGSGPAVAVPEGHCHGANAGGIGGADRPRGERVVGLGDQPSQAGMGGGIRRVVRYIGVFEQMYLLKRIDVWARNRLKRVAKTPKLQFIDSGLLANLMDIHAKDVQADRSRYGHVLESFVFDELLRHSTTSDGDYRLLYYRDADKFEVDVVIENSAGQLVGVEVKAAATVKERDLRGLKKLARQAGDQFTAGVLLYDGDETLPLGNKLWAAPISTLWGS